MSSDSEDDAAIIPLVDDRVGDAADEQDSDNDSDGEGVIREPPLCAWTSSSPTPKKTPWRLGGGRDGHDSESRELATDACYTYIKDQNRPDFDGLLFDDASSSSSEESVRLQRDAAQEEEKSEASVEHDPEAAPADPRREGSSLSTSLLANHFDDNDGGDDEEEASLFSRGAPTADFRPPGDWGAGRQASHRQLNPLERISRTLANWMEKDDDGRFRRRWGPHGQNGRDGAVDTHLVDRVAELERKLEEQRNTYEERIRELEDEVRRLKGISSEDDDGDVGGGSDNASDARSGNDADSDGDDSDA